MCISEKRNYTVEIVTISIDYITWIIQKDIKKREEESVRSNRSKTTFVGVIRTGVVDVV